MGFCRSQGRLPWNRSWKLFDGIHRGQCMSRRRFINYLDFLLDWLNPEKTSSGLELTFFFSLCSSLAWASILLNWNSRDIIACLIKLTVSSLSKMMRKRLSWWPFVICSAFGITPLPHSPTTFALNWRRVNMFYVIDVSLYVDYTEGIYHVCVCVCVCVNLSFSYLYVSSGTCTRLNRLYTCGQFLTILFVYEFICKHIKKRFIDFVHFMLCVCVCVCVLVLTCMCMCCSWCCQAWRTIQGS